MIHDMNTNFTDPKHLPDEFYLALAVGVRPYQDVLTMFDINEEAAANLNDHPVFQQRLLLARNAVESDGTAFFARCRLLAGDTMPKIVRIIQDEETPPSVKLEAWKSLVKYGRLEPQPQQGPPAPVLTLNFVGPDGSNLFPPAIASTPVPALPSPSGYEPEDDDWVDMPDRVSAAALGLVM